MANSAGYATPARLSSAAPAAVSSANGGGRSVLFRPPTPRWGGFELNFRSGNAGFPTLCRLELSFADMLELGPQVCFSGPVRVVAGFY
jgi:hypothetical protein